MNFDNMSVSDHHEGIGSVGKIFKGEHLKAREFLEHLKNSLKFISDFVVAEFSLEDIEEKQHEASIIRDNLSWLLNYGFNPQQIKEAIIFQSAANDEFGDEENQKIIYQLGEILGYENDIGEGAATDARVSTDDFLAEIKKSNLTIEQIGNAVSFIIDRVRYSDRSWRRDKQDRMQAPSEKPIDSLSADLERMMDELMETGLTTEEIQSTLVEMRSVSFLDLWDESIKDAKGWEKMQLTFGRSIVDAARAIKETTGLAKEKIEPQVKWLRDIFLNMKFTFSFDNMAQKLAAMNPEFFHYISNLIAVGIATMPGVVPEIAKLGSHSFLLSSSPDMLRLSIHSLVVIFMTFASLYFGVVSYSFDPRKYHNIRARLRILDKMEKGEIRSMPVKAARIFSYTWFIQIRQKIEKLVQTGNDRIISSGMDQLAMFSETMMSSTDGFLLVAPIFLSLGFESFSEFLDVPEESSQN